MSGAAISLGGHVLELTAPYEMDTVVRPDLSQPGPGQVVVRMVALGLCGTDLHIYSGRGSTYPWVTGHDGAGIIHSLGPGVDLEEGQRVAVDPVVRCEKCAMCRQGKVQLCANGGYLGMLGPGLAAEYVQLPAAQLIPLPDAVSDLAATVLEPVAVALHTLRRVEPLMPGQGAAAIIGGGPLGILQAQVSQHFGWDCVVFEPQKRRRDLGSSLGVKMFDPAEAEDIETLQGGPILVIETSAAAAGVDLAERIASPGSVVAIVGRGPHSPSPASILLKELSVLGIKGGPGMYSEAVRLVQEGVVDPASVITDQFPWSQGAKAFAHTVQNPETVVRSVLYGAWQ